MHRGWLLIVACLASCSTMTIRISRSEVQADLARRFPREVDKQVIVIRASDPEIELPGGRDVVAIRLRLDAETTGGRSHLRGTTRVEGRIDYVAAEHAFYLRDPRVTELELSSAEGHGVLTRLASKLEDHVVVDAAARAAIAELLRHHPIYRLDARRSAREAKAIRHLRSVRVDGDDLVMVVGL